MINHLIDLIHNKMPHIDTLAYRSKEASANSVQGNPSSGGMVNDRLWVSKDTLIHHAWSSSEMAPIVFAHRHLPSCDSCAVRFDESLEEAAEAYQIPLVEWLLALNFRITG